MKKNQWIGLGLGFLMTSCATHRVAGWDDSADINASESLEEAKHESPIGLKDQWMAEGYAHWKKRHIRSELEKALLKFKAVSKIAPEDLDSLILLSRGHFILADAHLHENSEKMKAWEKGIFWGERAMATFPGFKSKVKENFDEAVSVLPRSFVDAIYWTAANLGSWVKDSNIATQLKYKSRIRSMIKKVEDLDPKYFYGAVNRYWGAYYAIAPFFAGGSMEKSSESFKKSFSSQNHYLGSHVLFAETYAARKGNKELFKKELEWVINADPTVLPEIIPEQIIEQRKARAMLQNIDEYF
ncbi:MAG: hypothetical protein CL678_07815 [Bdellovibrionaceae bacterium]|nr:hypothetical protein [Pseudobdellovibrionaceae bacterium]|tara:strand:+ start:3638 stop:4534 length:897 start_codon:yes stop_codon:yes gene_type:complete